MISKELYVDSFDASTPVRENFASVDQLEARVAKIRNSTGPFFSLGYIDTPDSFIIKYNATHDLMDLQKFVEVFWKNPSDEAEREVLSARGRVGLMIQKLPEVRRAVGTDSESTTEQAEESAAHSASAL